MTNFKHKVDKTIKLNKIYDMSIDHQHKKMMEFYEENEKRDIPQIEKKIHNEKKRIEELKMLLKEYNEQDEYIDILDEYHKCKEQIKLYTKKLKELKKQKSKYLIENSKLIFDYFDDKQSMDTKQNNDTIMNFFNIKKNDDTMKTPNKENPLVKTYFSKLNDRYLDIQDYICDEDVCINCNRQSLSVHNDCLKVCNLCGKQYKQLSEQEKPSYKEPPKEICSYAYKRKNHFKEILSQFQGKETTEIPNHVMDDIKKQISKERITKSELTNTKMKNILKKLGYNNYYEHIAFIKTQLGIYPPIMSEELEETLCNMFDEIQAPYAKYCPNDRVNFLNYYGVLYKMCELLGEDKFLPHFHMLKDRIKRMEQDEIWKKICKELNWEFIPSV